MIQVLIVDDQVIVCEGLKVILNTDPEIEVVGMAFNGADAIERVATLQPTLVLMDLKMPEMNGVQTTRIIKERYPGMIVLVLTTYDADTWVIDAIRAGATGYLLKDSDRSTITAAIKGAIAGQSYLDPAVAPKLLNFVRHGASPSAEWLDLFSERELIILRLLASGLTNAAIAEHLNLAEGTVRNHVTQILAKLEVNDRAQATAMAWRYGLMSSVDDNKR
jgi:two-component system, NarL family, response regulator LiaR